MADDVLSFRTTIDTSQAEAGLKRLGGTLGQLERAGRGVGGLSNSFLRLGQAIRAAGHEMTTALPLLQAFQQTGGGIAGSLVAMGGAAAIAAKGASEISNRITQITHRTRELGMSARDIKAFESAFVQAGGTVEGADKSLEKFMQTMQGLRSNMGGNRAALENAGFGKIARELMSMGDGGQQVERALAFIKTLSDPLKRRIFAELTFGLEGARVEVDDFNRAQKDGFGYTKKEIEDSKRYNTELQKFSDAFDKLKVEFFGPLIPMLTSAVEAIRKYVENFNKAAPIEGEGGMFKGPGEGPFTPFGRGPGGPIQRPKGFRSGSIMGGDDRADTMLGSAERDMLEDTTEEGVFDALVRFASIQKAGGGGSGALGTGGAGSLGSGSVGGGGGGGPAARGGGGGPGGGGSELSGLPSGQYKAGSATHAHGVPIDRSMGPLAGKVLAEPMSGWMGGGTGGHSAKFGAGHHQGVDIMGPVGSDVFAMQEGEVIRAPSPGGGRDQTLIIRHPDGTYTRYLHQSPGNVKVGDKVARGQVVGKSGYRNAPHSHVEAWIGAPGAKGSKLIDLKQVFGWGSGKNATAVGGREVTVGQPGVGVAGAPAGAKVEGAPEGTTVGGAEFLAEKRARFKAELDADPALRRTLAALASKESDQNPAEVIESLMNRAEYTGQTLRQAIYGRGGKYKSFYAPIRKGEVEPRARRQDRDPKERAVYDAAIDRVLKGSNLIEGYTDQGMPGDTNYNAGGRGIDRGGNRFNLFGGGPEGHKGAAAWKARRQADVKAAESRRIDQANKTKTKPNGGQVKVDIETDGTQAKAKTETEGFDKTEVNRSKREQHEVEIGTPELVR